MHSRELVEEIYDKMILSFQPALPLDTRYLALWDALLKCANLISKKKDEKKRLAELVEKLPLSDIRSIMQDESLEELLSMDPPLETVLTSPHEELQSWVVDRVARLRHERTGSPRMAIVSLGYVLTGIRNKCAHGFKTARRNRDAEILSLSVQILRKICERTAQLLLVDGKRHNRSAYRVRVSKLGEESDDDAIVLSPTERLVMVWELTRQAWTFKEGKEPESRLRRDVVRVVRRGG